MAKKILIVDDNPVMSTQLAGFLEKKGHKVATAQDGFSALNTLTSFIPDIAFIDMIMPNISGDKLCQLIRKMPHLDSCYLVIVSAAVIELEFNHRDIGADACIAKGPFDEMFRHVLDVIEESELNSNPDGQKPIRGTESVAGRRITKELISQSHHLEAILESIPEGVLEILEGKIVYANSTAAGLFEKPLEEIPGCEFSALFKENSRDRVTALLGGKSSETSKIENEGSFTLGSREVILKNVALGDVSKTNLVIMTDETEYRAVERALKEAMEYNENVINTMAGLLLVLKSDLTIRFVNQATCNILGYSPHELFGKRIESVIFDDVSIEDKLVDRIVRGETISDQTMAFKSKSGERIPVSFLATAMYESMDEKKEPLGIICIAYDIREIEALQQQLFHAEKMAACGVLSAGVAHEIKNPLAVILQGLEALKTGVKSNPDLVPDIIERIRNAALRGNKIVEGLLDFSRQSNPEVGETDLLEILGESISLVKHHFKRNDINVVEQPAKRDHRIHADAHQIKQVFINILVNAAEAMPSGGTLKILTEITEQEDGGTCIKVIFSDTGPGIPEDILSKVMEPFFTTKTKSMNTGLGLSISQGILSRHDASLQIESAPGEGARVSVILPVKSDGEGP